MNRNQTPSNQEIRRAILSRMEEALDHYVEGKLTKHQLKWAILSFGTAYSNPRQIRSRYYE